MIQIPDTLSEYDFLELAAFDRKVRIEGYGYAAEHYPPRFEFADYVLLDRDALRALWQREVGAIGERRYADPDAASDAHNAHVDEARQRARHRALWAVRFASGNVSTCDTEAEARSLHTTPGWNIEALLTRDEPGGEWREVAGAVA